MVGRLLRKGNTALLLGNVNWCSHYGNSMESPQKVSSSNSTPGYLSEVNSYSVNNRVSKYMKRKLIKVQEEIDKSTIIVSDFNASLQ